MRYSGVLYNLSRIRCRYHLQALLVPLRKESLSNIARGQDRAYVVRQRESAVQTMLGTTGAASEELHLMSMLKSISAFAKTVTVSVEVQPQSIVVTRSSGQEGMDLLCILLSPSVQGRVHTDAPHLGGIFVNQKTTQPGEIIKGPGYFTVLGTLFNSKSYGPFFVPATKVTAHAFQNGLV